MLIDFTSEIKEITGESIKVENGKPAISLKSISVNALLAQLQSEQNIEGKEKLDRFILAEKIQKSTDQLELTAEEVSKIKLMIGKVYSTLIVGQAYRLLEG